MIKHRKDGGQMIAEVVIAIGIISVVLVSLSELMSRSTVSIRLNKQKDEAGRAVEARLACFRQERDRNAGNFFTNVVHNLEGGTFTSCSLCSGSTWPITTQYTFACTERFTSAASGVKAEVRASWTNKTTNDMNVTLVTIISEP
jgi:type II secretory pathway pseudopilin PulG